MLRQARAAGLLSTSSAAFATWMRLNEVDTHELQVQKIPLKGTGLTAAQHVKNSDNGSECLLTVPKDLILSLERVKEHAKVDQDLKEVLDAASARETARSAILLFLLLQLTTACGPRYGSLGVHSPFVEYVKSLTPESLPTVWTHEELALLRGTSLAPATSFKLRRLRSEYDTLCEAASQTRWYQRVQDYLSFDDWVEVDSMYRSRALEYPGIGHCMVPCLDLANHESGDGTIAVYELDKEGNAILLLRDGKDLQPGEEVTISYGDEKGACEMLFSYGFLEASMQTAEAIFLDLGIVDNDPQAAGKRRLADCAPGVKLIDAGEGEFDWQGDFIWLLCVSAEDGLHFVVARLTDGSEEVQAIFGEHELKGGTADLRSQLANGPLWDLYGLRAIAILQDRVFQQLQLLDDTHGAIECASHGSGESISTQRYKQAMTLRRLEFDMLNMAYEDFERQKIDLAKSEVVQSYLSRVNAQSTTDELEDFS